MNLQIRCDFPFIFLINFNNFNSSILGHMSLTVHVCQFISFLRHSSFQQLLSPFLFYDIQLSNNFPIRLHSMTPNFPTATFSCLLIATKSIFFKWHPAFQQWGLPSYNVGVRFLLSNSKIVQSELFIYWIWCFEWIILQ
jgi:hypothetical protein